jgi:hypothetical protein
MKLGVRGFKSILDKKNPFPRSCRFIPWIRSTRLLWQSTRPEKALVKRLWCLVVEFQRDYANIHHDSEDIDYGYSHGYVSRPKRYLDIQYSQKVSVLKDLDEHDEKALDVACYLIKTHVLWSLACSLVIVTREQQYQRTP